jgi:hypothetical protein
MKTTNIVGYMEIKEIKMKLMRYKRLLVPVFLTVGASFL